MADPGAAFDLLGVVARALIALLFLYSAFIKLRGWDAGLREVRDLGLPWPAAVLVATVALQLCGGWMLLLGWQARWAAAALAGFTLLASLMAHPFWRSGRGGEALRQRLTFSEHLAIVGGLLMVVAHG